MRISLSKPRLISANSRTLGSLRHIESCRGLSFAKLGENLARARDFRGALQAMLESPGHKTNLLHPRYRQIGVSAFRDVHNDGYSYCLLFLEPRPSE